MRRFAPKRLLIAHAEPAILALLLAELDAEPGIEVTGQTCERGDIARLLRRDRPDAAIIDATILEAPDLRQLLLVGAASPATVIVLSGPARARPTSDELAMSGALAWVECSGDLASWWSEIRDALGWRGGSARPVADVWQ